LQVRFLPGVLATAGHFGGRAIGGWHLIGKIRESRQVCMGIGRGRRWLRFGYSAGLEEVSL
jgi:hypothetical protein